MNSEAYEITYTGTFDTELSGFLSDRITEYNMETTGVTDGRGLTITVRDAEGEIAGGLAGFTWGGMCKVRLLWVRADARGRGLGSRLMAMAESEARARNCRQMLLETHSFQAPDFYQALGFRIVGTVENYPDGHRYYMLAKRL